jgi:beta-N-acetylhexosaminidase
MVRFWHIGWVSFLLLSLGFLGTPERSVAAFQAPQSAQDLLDEMTVEERVGQLFLVAFEGDSVAPSSDIVDLILNYKVGGVVLLPKNDNLTGYGEPLNTPLQIMALTSELQRLALLGELPIVDEEDVGRGAEIITTPQFAQNPGAQIPLFFALNHEGIPYGESRILGGFTGVPTNMAIGATWQPRYAQTVGRITGQELAAVGVNMLLGPALDVLENPAPSNPADLGANTFGGDPYWVGLMGQAYTTGVHEGSQNRVAVIAKHFPGKGSSDRHTDVEVPTVRKSLEQLKQIELAPFIAVTGSDQEEPSVVDGLLTTHIRYQGFQGNIRDTTAPVSFDPQALTSLMDLPEFIPWRQAGGIIVSDSLGARSVARFYDSTEEEFPHQLVAKDAFLAGNDLLNLSDFALGEASFADQSTNIKDTILWFRNKYETDQSFQQRVDTAVLRILQLKLDLYGDDLSASNVLPEPANIATQIGQGDPFIFNLTQAGTTLISPSLGELAERVASPPGAGDKIAVFTDVREASQCSACPPGAIVSETALAERMVALYGPNGSGQLQPSQVESFSFVELEEFLNAGTEPIFLPTQVPIPTLTAEEVALNPTPFLTPTPPADFLVQESLKGTNWIVFALLNGDMQSQTLSRFLAERPDIVRNTNVMVFALDAPYYLDTTEISKLTAYYGIYSTVDMFIDTAVRALFQEVPLTGSSPVSIDGIGYNLFEQTQPDPQQIIELYILSGQDVQSPPSQAPLDAAIGDTLHLQTGIIRDRNGNLVPNGTIVQFVQRDRIQGTVNIIAEVPTENGTSRLDYVLEARTGPGQFRITASAGEATISQEVDISIEDEAQVAIIVPTTVPTATATPTTTPTATTVPSATPTPSPTATPLPPPPPPSEPGIRIALSELEMLLTMFTGLVIIVSATLLFGSENLSTADRTGALLWSVIGALLVYLYYTLQLPGADLIGDLGNWAGLATTLLGGAVGWLVYQTTRGFRVSRTS